MVYSCAYYTDWANGIEQAQRDKLEMICRKLRLKPGDRMLDIGAGWGGLLCHAAKNYGVTAHGITLSEEQLSFAQNKAKMMGLDDRVTFALADYTKVTGTYDKIASIGMYEHIGIKNIPLYMSKVRSLLSDEGLFLNHAISRRAPKHARAGLSVRCGPRKKPSPNTFFPAASSTISVTRLRRWNAPVSKCTTLKAWRLHYARTCQLWCERLTDNKDEAIRYVGEEKYRIWVAYLAGVSLAFSRGTLRLFQTLASKSAKRTPVLPPTRADLYR